MIELAEATIFKGCWDNRRGDIIVVPEGDLAAGGELAVEGGDLIGGGGRGDLADDGGDLIGVEYKGAATGDVKFINGDEMLGVIFDGMFILIASFSCLNINVYIYNVNTLFLKSFYTLFIFSDMVAL